MAFEIAYLDYDELVTFKTDFLHLASDRILTSNNGEMMPHLVLRATWTLERLSTIYSRECRESRRPKASIGGFAA
ncbi:TPA: hypothetical protein ACQTZL_005998 [Pseudomonas aeruginosa]|uniref:hypothetical protein n=1 Tax=Pseudomonas aeruginosa TaxID=287 RepID=UPI001A1F1A25|nr:hypothetical protein [Pseudomonas aeruginosa]WNO24951.1 hypothetical protein FGKDOCBF_00022 [Pseudomonas phage LPPA56]MBG7459969.1 hypothetical protein [Pseudomonas aeruginosa]MBH4269525.1 hypothetical protein [Pseudomonas aeruginosa]MBI6980808.1 hypothetical protein [Pseudomonas aeruginosa]MBI7073835.1 hypothetical protein [Pseudomonas aeruginosa]